MKLPSGLIVTVGQRVSGGGGNHRAKIAERAGRVAVVLGVQMEECPACGARYLDGDVSRRLDEMFSSMLAGDVEAATRHFDSSTAAA